jgi:hypothetical protein
MDLLLAHLLEIPEYKDFYLWKRVHRPEAHFTLDNSAHELKEGQAIERLMSIASELQVNEVVIPDALFNAEKTVDNLIVSLDYLINDHQFTGLYNYMLVPQGETFEEYVWCLEEMLQSYHTVMSRFPNKFRPPVIGVSKDYDDMFHGGLERLIETVILPKSSMYGPKRLQIHLLGWMRSLWKLNPINNRFGRMIRSVDSSRPFTFAMFNVNLRNHIDSVEPNYPGRPDDFFTRPWDIERTELARVNSEVFLRMTRNSAERFRDHLKTAIRDTVYSGDGLL